LDDVTYDTVQKVAQAVLPPEIYEQWKVDYTNETNQLRKEFNMPGEFDLSGNLIK